MLQILNYTLFFLNLTIVAIHRPLYPIRKTFSVKLQRTVSNVQNDYVTFKIWKGIAAKSLIDLLLF